MPVIKFEQDIAIRAKDYFIFMRDSTLMLGDNNVQIKTDNDLKERTLTFTAPDGESFTMDYETALSALPSMRTVGRLDPEIDAMASEVVRLCLEIKYGVEIPFIPEEETKDDG